jgi:hypothetical protein
MLGNNEKNNLLIKRISIAPCVWAEEVFLF